MGGMNSTTTKLVALKDTKAVPTHFRGHARYGRTTTLITKDGGTVLGVFMGAATRADCYAAYLKGCR